MEIITITVYVIEGLTTLLDNYSPKPKKVDSLKDSGIEGLLDETKTKKKKSKSVAVILFLGDLLLAVPFSLFFERNETDGRYTKPFLIILQLLRLFSAKFLFWIFGSRYFKKRPGLANVLTAIYGFALFNHIGGCILMIIGNTVDNFNYTWLSRVPAPQFTFPDNNRDVPPSSIRTKYVSAIYWSHMTTSHIGVGDITAISPQEKFFCTIMLYMSTFVYAFLFGNLVSLVDDLIQKYQKDFEDNYRSVLEFQKRAKVEKYTDKIHKYFDYIWETNKGFEEKQLLEDLPPLLRVDVQMARYHDIIIKSRFFKENGELNSSIVSYFFKKCSYMIVITEDVILSSGQQTNNVYFILDGEVEGYDSILDKTRRFLPGDYFGGYIPVIIQIYEFKATKITKLAVLDEKSFNFLCEAKNAWIEALRMQNRGYRAIVRLQRAIKGWLQNKKSAQNPQEDATSPFRAITTENPFTPTPGNLEGNTDFNKRDMPLRGTVKTGGPLRSRTIKNLRKLLKKHKLLLLPTSATKMIMESIHFLLILYTIFALPIIVGFDLKLSSFFLAMEYVVLIEGIVYTILQFKTAQYESGILTLNPKIVFKQYWKKGFLSEIIGQIPLNLIFHYAGITHPRVIISLLRLHRIILISRIPGILSQLISKYPKLMRPTSFLKPIFLLSFIWHFSSLMWMWFNIVVEKENDFDVYWLKFLELEKKPIIKQYFYCLHWTMNIATTCGYSEQIIYNDYERIVFILMSYIGGGLFALAFGMMAANTRVLPERYERVYETVCKLEGIFQKKGPTKLKKKLEVYYAYMMDSNRNNAMSIDALTKIIPPALVLIVGDFIFEMSEILFMHPVFKAIDSKVCLIELVSAMTHSFYLPGDYVVQKEDYGTEIMFIVEGIMKCYSINERQTILKLQAGDFFGEKALLGVTKRIYPIVAETFCSVFSLSKANFDAILDKFPQIAVVVKDMLERRIKSLTLEEDPSVKSKRKQSIKIVKEQLMRGHRDQTLFEKLLLAMEIPVRELVASQDRKIDEAQLMQTKLKAFSIKKIKLIAGTEAEADDSEDSDEEFRNEEEFVEEDEMKNQEMNFNKVSIRTPGQENQRRYSRIVLGSEKSISKENGFKIKWGVNIS